MLHRKTFKPIGTAKIFVFGEMGLAILPPPLTNVQVPIFGKIAVFAVIGPVEEFVHMVELGPAMACCDN